MLVESRNMFAEGGQLFIKSCNLFVKVEVV